MREEIVRIYGRADKDDKGAGEERWREKRASARVRCVSRFSAGGEFPPTASRKEIETERMREEEVE